jgi:hypothetical protein
MKATIDIPDELYRQVKAKSAMRGQAVREVTIHLFQGWVSQNDTLAAEASIPPDSEHVPSWFGGARTYAQEVRQHDMSSVRDSIAQGRKVEESRKQ